MPSRTTDALILGAGAAGLAAARALSAAGLTLRVLEARARIGGRIHTRRDRAAPVPIELGAEFIHGRPQATFDLLRESGQLAVDLPFENLVRRGRRLVKVADFSDELGSVMGGLARLKGRDISFARYLDTHHAGQSPRARRLALAFVEGFDAADPRRISARSLAREQEGLGDVGEEMQFRPLAGYAPLMDFLLRGLDPQRARLHLRTRALGVRWRRGQVEVLAAGPRGQERFRARRAIIALPLGVLHVPPDAPGGVRFTPEVDVVRRALEMLGSGPVVKAVLCLREPMWESPAVARAAGAGPTLKDASFLQDLDAPFPTLWTQRPLRAAVITAWAGGPRALALSGLPRARLIEAAVASLASVLGVPAPRVRAQVVSAHVYDWRADPWSRGAYSYELVGAGEARRRLCQSLKRTLWFAGEHCDPDGQASTVAGALASGLRAARDLARSL